MNNFDQHDLFEFKKTMRYYTISVAVVSLALLLLFTMRSCEVKPAMAHRGTIALETAESTLESTFDLETNWDTFVPDSTHKQELLADAIYWAEGGKKAVKPFGILSVKCEGYYDCRTVCLRTIRNNIARHTASREGLSYLEFLGRRYAPVGASNDKDDLNRHWLDNVTWFLEHPKEVE